MKISSEKLYNVIPQNLSAQIMTLISEIDKNRAIDVLSDDIILLFSSLERMQKKMGSPTHFEYLHFNYIDVVRVYFLLEVSNKFSSHFTPLLIMIIKFSDDDEFPTRMKNSRTNFACLV